MSLFTTGVLNFIVELFRDLVKDKSKDLVNNSIKDRTKWRHFFSKRLHYYKELENAIREMPFIYKDIELDVMSDFQHIKAIQIITDGLEIKIVNKKAEISSHSIDNYFFSDYKKLLILGNAGMGKSTFLRYLVLCIIQNRRNKYLKNIENIIPILIPLKAIQNHQKSPILEYIFSQLSLYTENKGKARFLKDAKKKNVLLLLDGYDELGFTQGVNYAQYEINVLLSTRIEKIDDTKINVEYKEFYSALLSCGTCLSSREEFYRTFSLKAIETPHAVSFQSLGHVLKDFIALRILGLEGNRVDFARSIFNRYRKRSKIFDENLDEELFINNIDKTHDFELIDFSRTPLFLTIMCYIYAEKIKEQPSALADVWELRIEELISECVKTLLRDLDEYKVRNLKKAQQIAFTRRRSEFFEEKLAFLKYFSFELINQGLPIFDRTFIVKQVEQFFSELYKNKNSLLILEELKNPTSDNPDFPTQLIFSGIFCTVNIISNNTSYDYPHRRFRETLAIKYLEENNKLHELLDAITNPTLTEFTILVFITKEIYRKDITQSLLNKFYVDNHYENANSILYECVLKTNYDITDFVELNIQNWIINNARVKIHPKVLGTFAFNHSFIKSLEYEIGKISGDNLHAINLAVTILSQVKEVNLIDLSFNGIRKSSHSKQLYVFVLYFKTIFECMNRNKIIEKYSYKSDADIVSIIIEQIKEKSRKKEELSIEWINALPYLQKKEIVFTDFFNPRIQSSLIYSLLKDNSFLNSLTFDEKIVLICNPNYLEQVNKHFLKLFFSESFVLETISLIECNNIIRTLSIDSAMYKKKINDIFIEHQFPIDNLSCIERLALVIGLFKATNVIIPDTNKKFLFDFDNYLINEDIFEGVKISNMVKQISPQIDNYLFDNNIIYTYLALLRDRIPNQPHSSLDKSSFILELKGIIESNGKDNVVANRKERLNLKNSEYYLFYETLYNMLMEVVPETVPEKKVKLKREDIKKLGTNAKLLAERKAEEEAEAKLLKKNAESIEQAKLRNAIKEPKYISLMNKINTQKYDVTFLDSILI